MDIACSKEWQHHPKGLPLGATWAKHILVTFSVAVMLLSDAVMAMSAIEPTLGQSYINYQLVEQSGKLFDGSPTQLVSLPTQTDVEMQVTGWVNRARVKQTFVNHTEHWMRGQFQFPLPHDAAIDTLIMRVGERKLVGVIKPKAQAKAMFEQAQKQGKTATLTVQRRPNLFSNAFTNLAPGETLHVELVYQQRLQLRNGQFALRFPTAITPRYEAVRTSSASRIDDAALAPANTSFVAAKQAHMTLNITLNAQADISSISAPYHDIEVSSKNSSELNVALKEATRPERDFVLNWQMRSAQQPVIAAFSQAGITHRGLPSTKDNEFLQDSLPSAEQEYGLVMVNPSYGSERQVHRELILVVDTSGSMYGESIQQAKSALITALADLGSQDTFNIIAFDSHTRSFAPYAMPVTARMLGKAQQFIRQLSADGGTEMSAALTEALQHQVLANPHQGNVASKAQLRQVIFITDGAVGNEQTLFNQITEQLGDSRLFTVGIGAAPNGYFMEKAARVGRGTYTYIGKVEEVEVKMQQLLSAISTPRLTDIKIASKSGQPLDVWPQRQRDVYQDQALMFSYKKPLVADSIVISGLLDGQYWYTEVEPQPASEMPGLDIVWAREKIAGLMLARRSDNRDAIKREVTALALSHHIVSQYTSLVAIDDVARRNQGQSLMQGQTAQNLPKGWQVGRLPQTATMSPLLLFLGSVMLMFGGALYVSYRHLFNIKGSKLALEGSVTGPV
ncbi:marine proteobacterial sortase target protein [Shewanella sp. Scap07]|uniref:marine proteobacterial sortase target protein n=1 Tax=Shewanella sp. Scap07 TaxID=2589987 RepID=UPI0015B8ED65|nr:marine proteobacterial sortase target protein [Shewanella sp. Scap07]QLE85369.1 marine proteobacterial sortase target protein [Shewanella sp. Scap07]